MPSALTHLALAAKIVLHNPTTATLHMTVLATHAILRIGQYSNNAVRGAQYFICAVQYGHHTTCPILQTSSTQAGFQESRTHDIFFKIQAADWKAKREDDAVLSDQRCSSCCGRRC